MHLSEICATWPQNCPREQYKLIYPHIRGYKYTHMSKFHTRTSTTRRTHSSSRPIVSPQDKSPTTLGVNRASFIFFFLSFFLCLSVQLVRMVILFFFFVVVCVRVFFEIKRREFSWDKFYRTHEIYEKKIYSLSLPQDRPYYPCFWFLFTQRFLYHDDSNRNSSPIKQFDNYV